MTGGELIAEVKARGFDYVDDTRILRWVNLAYARICDREAWPFLETTTTGTSPLTISDVRAVLSVVDTDNNNPLSWEDVRTILERDPTLTLTGGPTSWYLEGDDLTAYPTSANNLSVRYINVPADLSEDDDPVFGSRYHYVIVDGAVFEAYKDSDNFEAVTAMEAMFERGISEMRNAVLVPNYDTAAEITPSFLGSSDW